MVDDFETDVTASNGFISYAEESYDFEFERKFFLQALPPEIEHEPNPTIIVQGYFLAQDGYCLRLRLQATAVANRLNVCDRSVIEEHRNDFDFAAITVKGPHSGGTRYEIEKEIDVNVAIEMLRRAGHLVVKNRYSLWHLEDGWVIDQFFGDNAPLLLAEVERGNPVTDLHIPAWCITEVTDDKRFSNDALAHTPYCQFAQAWQQELLKTGPRFLQEFGKNHVQEK